MFIRGYVRLCVCSLTGSGVTDGAFVNSGHQYAQVRTVAAFRISKHPSSGSLSDS